MSNKSLIVRFDVPMYAVIPEDNNLYEQSSALDMVLLKKAFVGSLIDNHSTSSLLTKALDKSCARKRGDGKFYHPDDAIRIYLDNKEEM